MIISKPGVYDIPADVYHSDPCAEPSLSASIAKILDDKSPAHARHAHPRLNPTDDVDGKKSFDLGSACHQLLLGSDDEIVVINPADYPSKNGNIPTGYTNDAIREARDAAYAARKIPLLPDQHAQAVSMSEAAAAKMDQNEELSGWKSRGNPERVLIWQEGGIWCRSRLDWMPDDGKGFFLDIKTTEMSVNPEVIGRYAMNMGWDIQEAFYRRGLKALGISANPKFRFVAIEQSPPFAMAVVAIPPQVAEHADHKVEKMVQLWGECIRSGDWPDYPRRTVWIDPPPWSFTRHQERWARPEPMFKPERKSVPSADALRRSDAAQAPLHVEGDDR